VYKSPMGNKVVFEERNEGLGLVFLYRWTFSPRYGFRSRLRPHEYRQQQSRSLDLLDGLQNVLPCGVGQDFWLRYSNLGNAYKKSELLESSQSRASTISAPFRRIERSRVKGLRSTVVWHDGFHPGCHPALSCTIAGSLLWRQDSHRTRWCAARRRHS
jgi:hypothetical protein